MTGVIIKIFVLANGQNNMNDIVVEVYDEHIKINIETGMGYDKVLEKMDPLLNSYSYKFKIETMEPEDVKQELVIIVLEGIANYNHEKNVKLSTFLHTHIFNKIISKINSTLKKSNNASFLKTKNKFNKTLSLEDLGDSSENFISDTNFFDEEGSDDFSFLLYNLKNIFDDLTWNVFESIYIKSNTIKDCANDLGIEIWVVSNIIKKIKKNEEIIRFYEQS